MKTLSKLMILVMMTAAVVSCNKDNDSDQQKSNPVLSVRLMDAPGAYDAVNVEVISIRANIDSNWVEFPLENPGVYNLMEFTNGNTLLLIGDTSVSPGVMTELRLVLGTDNSVVVDGISYPLQTPSGQSSGYKIKMDLQPLEPGGLYRLVVDFDVSVSVHQTGNGKYMLKPVVRGYLETAVGGIAGTIVPANAAFYVEAYNAVDTAGTVIDTITGNFLISAFPGTYDVTFHADTAYSDTTFMGVIVVAGAVTQMDTVYIE